jgi:hypothetical protein
MIPPSFVEGSERVRVQRNSDDKKRPKKREKIISFSSNFLHIGIRHLTWISGVLLYEDQCHGINIEKLHENEGHKVQNKSSHTAMSGNSLVIS